MIKTQNVAEQSSCVKPHSNPTVSISLHIGYIQDFNQNAVMFMCVRAFKYHIYKYILLR